MLDFHSKEVNSKVFSRFKEKLLTFFYLLHCLSINLDKHVHDLSFIQI